MSNVEVISSLDTEIWSQDLEKDQFNAIWTRLFQAASYLTDPACKSHEFAQRLKVLETLDPSASKTSKFLLFAGVWGFRLLAVPLTMPAILLRYIASSLQKNHFLYDKTKAAGKTLPDDRTFTLLSWNICGAGAGYAITDGGVVPWPFRIDALLQQIIEKDADVNCLYEVFDIKTALFLCDKLKQKGYGHFYFNIGTKAVGVNSGIFVASKYEIKNPEFTPFSQEMLVGRTKHAGKGIFAFDLKSANQNFARVFTTHLQHSEECIYPTDEEKESRRRQMEVMMQKVDSVKNKCVIVTGDLNLDDEEYRASSWQSRFTKGDLYMDPDRTWGGDEFCAKLVQKKVSTPLNLDHTMILNGTAQSIKTDLVRTGYDATRFLPKALSDHEGLFSSITVY